MKNPQIVMDKTAIVFSTACALHCVFTPIMLAVLPALTATAFGDELFHKILLLAVLPFSSIAFISACRRHQKWKVLSHGFVGLYILVATALFGHEFLGELGEKIATVLGASIVAYSHVQNFRLCREDSCHEDDNS